MEIAIAVFFLVCLLVGRNFLIYSREYLWAEDEPRCAKLQSWQFTPCPLQMALLEEKIMLTYNKSSKMYCLYVS